MAQDIYDDELYDENNCDTISLSDLDTFDPESPWKNITFSRIHHGKKFKFHRKNRDNVIRAKINDTNQHILLKQVIDTAFISKISIEFTILNHVQNSIIGLVEYPLKYKAADVDQIDEKEIDIKSIGLYGDKALEYTSFKDSYFGVGTSEFIGEDNVFRLWNPTRSNPKRLTMDFGFKDGDTLIMVIDGEERECCIYVNQINDHYLIRNQLKKKLYTFKHIPQQFIIIYGAHADAVDSAEIDSNRISNIEVEVRLLKLLAKEEEEDDDDDDEDADDEDIDEYAAEEEDINMDHIDIKQEDDERRSSKKRKSNNLLDVSSPSRPRSKSAEPHKKRKKKRKKRKKKQKFADIEVDANTDGDIDIDIDIDIDNYDWNSFRPKSNDDDDDKEDEISQFRRSSSKRKRTKKQVHYDEEEDEHNEDEHNENHKKKKHKKRHKKKRKRRNTEHKKKHKKHKRHNESETEDESDIDLERSNSHRGHKKHHHKRKKKKRRHSHHSNALQVRAEEETVREKEHKHKKKKRKKKRRHTHDSNALQDYAETLASNDDNDAKEENKYRKKRRHTHDSNKLQESVDKYLSENSEEEEEEYDWNTIKTKKESKRRRNSYDGSDALADNARKYRTKNDKTHSYRSRIEVTTPKSPNYSGDDEDNDDENDDRAAYHLRLKRARSYSPPAAEERTHIKPLPPSSPAPSSELLNAAQDELDELCASRMASEECYVLSRCLAVKRILILLQFYQKILNQMHHKNDIIIIYCSKYKHLLNDYHHILRVHLNGASKKENDVKFALIYEKIRREIKCDICKCNSFCRNNENKEDKKYIPLKDRRLAFYISILDTIHCTFVHSYDAGFKFKVREEEEYDDDDDDDEKSNINEDKIMINAFTDRKLQYFNEKLPKQYEFLSSIRGSQRMQLNKFSNDFKGYKDSNDTNNKLFPYNFGQRFYYWPFYRDNNEEDILYNKGSKYCDWFIAPKYLNLKEEVLSNCIYSLGRKQYILSQFAAEMFMDTNYVRAHIKQETEYALFETKERLCKRENADEFVYGITSYSKITCDHILSIVLFCTYSELRLFFADTFKRLSHRNETDFSFKERHREFHHFAKLLRECVEIYGDWISSQNKNTSFYTSISCKIIFDKFSDCLNLPISSTNELALICLYQYSSDDGYILELTQNNDSPISPFVKYFNCSFLSPASYENERLFIGGWASIAFKSIVCVQQNHNYKCFFVAINILQSAINGDKHRKAISAQQYLIIDKLIRYELNSFKIATNNMQIYPLYPTELFHSFVNNVKVVKIHLNNMSFSYLALKKYFIQPPKAKNILNNNLEPNLYDGASSSGHTDADSDDFNLFVAEMPAFQYITNLCPQCVEIIVEMTNAKNCITRNFLAQLANIINKLKDCTKLEAIRLNNIRNRCNDKDLKRFISFIESAKSKNKKKNKKKENWSINIITSMAAKNKNKQKYKYQYDITKNKQARSSLMNKMKNMFGAQRRSQQQQKQLQQLRQ